MELGLHDFADGRIPLPIMLIGDDPISEFCYYHKEGKKRYLLPRVTPKTF